MPRVCVFAGASCGKRSAYEQAARELGTEIARRGLSLVYGGGSAGLMGATAEAALHHGADVIGVLPRPLAHMEIAHPGLTELRVTSSMHERKDVMVELADLFIALPGGLGTLNELFEVLTWSQLGFHDKPCGLLDVCGYYGTLCSFLDHAVQEQFVQSTHRAELIVATRAAQLLDRLLP